MHNTYSYDYDEYILSADDESHEYTLEDGGSKSWDNELKYYHCANLLPYPRKDTRNKDNFNITDIYKEENEVLDCYSDIYRGEIDDPHYSCAVSNEIK